MEEDKDFIDFEFNGHWASEFKLLAVSDGDRYTSPFYGSVSPNTSTLIGKVGVHKWKTQVGEKEFNIQIAYDDVDLGTLRKIKEWLNPFVIGKLVFKEEPYKYYWVSLSEDPQISFLPFRTEDLIVDGKSYKKGVYKGDFTLNFICVDNYGYSDWSSFDENFDYLVNEIKGENFITFDDGSDNNLILTKIEGGFAQETKSAIPYTNVEGNNLQLTDVENVDTQNWIIKGGHHQIQTIQNDNLLILEDTTIAKNGITLTIKDGVITIDGTSTASTNIDFKIKKKLKAGTYRHMVQRDSGSANGNISFLIMKSSGSVSTMNGSGGANFTLEEDTEVFYRIWTDKNNTISNVVYKCIISEGSDSKPWVQGIPDSPSIDYSSEIETVGSNVNLCDNSKILVGVDPKDSSEKDFRTSDYIKVEYGKSYIASLYNEKKVRIGNLVYQEWNKNLEKLQQITTDTIKITNQDIAYVTVRNYKNDAEEIKNEFYYKFEESLIATPYSPYNQGGVEIDVVNSNLLDFNVAQDSRVTVNEDGTLTINGAGGFSLNIDKLQLKAGITYYQKVELISGSISGSNINNTFLSFAGTEKWISSEIFTESSFNEDTEKTVIWINASVIFNNAVIKIWANTDKSDFVLHQSKTAIIPIQQEMLDGDYIDKSKEYHKWRKVIFKGTETVVYAVVFGDYFLFQVDIGTPLPLKSGKILCNCFEKKPNWNVQVSAINWGEASGNMIQITIPVTAIKETTAHGAQAWLKEMNDKGSPVTVYFELREPTKLGLTTEQKTAMNELNTLQFYPNITNLSLSNSVAKVNFDYNGYDGMPSPRYPSDLQVVKDSVDITISNKNLFDFNKLNTQNTNLTIQGNKLIGNNVPNIVIGAAPDSTALMKKTLLPGTYTVSFDITSENSNELLNCYFCCQQVDGTYNNYYNGKATILLPNEKNRVFYEYKITKAVQKISIVGYLQGNTNLEISNIAIIEGTDNKYTEYKEQVISMPVQQELFKDDYIEDVEHHEWKKIIVDGVNYGSPSYVFPNGMFVLHNLKEAQVIKDAIPQKDWAVVENNIVCSHLPTTTTHSIQVIGKKGISNNPSGLIIMKIDDSTADNSTWTSEAVNEYLQQQNEKGQPLIVWYKTTEPYDLELTEDQADIKENCKDFVYSYPGANYISANTTLPKLSISYMPEQDLTIDFVADGSNLLNSSSFYYTNEIYLKSFKDKETGNPDTSGITSSRAEYLFNAGNQPANLNLTFDYIPPQQGAPLEINIDKVQLTNNGWKTLEKKYTSISLEYFEAFKPFTDLLKKAYSIDDLSNLPSNWQNDWQLEINSEIKEIYFKNKHNKDLVISLNKFNKKQEFLQLCGSNFVDYSKPFPTLITEVEESAIADTYFNKVYLTATAQDYRLKNINLEWKHTYL